MLFRLRLFGGASIEGPAGPLAGRAVQRRRLAFLALLAMARWRGLTRDRIIAYLWPDADPERARHLLSDSVYRINQALGGDAVLATGDDLRLNPGRLSSDAWEYADAIEQEDWERAAALYAAPFLDGFFVPDSGEFDRWADSERERLRREHARALEALALAAESMSNDDAAVRWWRKLRRRPLQLPRRIAFDACPRTDGRPGRRRAVLPQSFGSRANGTRCGPRPRAAPHGRAAAHDRVTGPATGPTP